jgi:hypothetical protein
MAIPLLILFTESLDVRSAVRIELVDHLLGSTEADAIFATGYGHVVTVQDDADRVEAAHEIGDLRHALLAECVYSRLIRVSGKGAPRFRAAAPS